MLGHELTHIRNGDVRMLVIAVIIAGVISFFAEMFFRMFFYSRGGWARSSGDSDRGKGGAGIAIVIAIALIALAWFLSVVIRFALSRRREFLADAGSVELTKNPDAMISALRKIENRGELEGATSAVMEMCVDNPREGFEDLFATHPAVDKRVDALVRFAGGHDPGPLAVPQFDETLARPSSRKSPQEQQTAAATGHSARRTRAASRSCRSVRRSSSARHRPDRLVAVVRSWPMGTAWRQHALTAASNRCRCGAPRGRARAREPVRCGAVSDPAGLRNRDAGPYDFMTCQEIIGQRAPTDRAREASCPISPKRRKHRRAAFW